MGKACARHVRSGSFRSLFARTVESLDSSPGKSTAAVPPMVVAGPLPSLAGDTGEPRGSPSVRRTGPRTPRCVVQPVAARQGAVRGRGGARSTSFNRRAGRRTGASRRCHPVGRPAVIRGLGLVAHPVEMAAQVKRRPRRTPEELTHSHRQPRQDYRPDGTWLPPGSSDTVVFLDAQSLLAPGALARIARMTLREPGVWIYTDDDLLDSAGRRRSEPQGGVQS